MTLHLPHHDNAKVYKNKTLSVLPDRVLRKVLSPES
ncbi:hypothetical protein MgSA37_04318 [Mucilaginibacter gotjawali]|uniref:Uncharacterized protein n=2 Tax=Mucilaginibacter gotjawali TaxID=1550579 RepID=A0A839SEE1_9SPHI|nr:hypothetical protein [Mucilaginibacter gotjawali]BAU56121.1 hypothetical protein MgSA37_04318 [Mucilaginibacter gotjawali]